jgi:hypothetical protein
LIEIVFADDRQVDETEYFNLKLTLEALGNTEDELDKLIRKYLKSKGLEEDYKVIKDTEDETIWENPWWFCSGSAEIG